MKKSLFILIAVILLSSVVKSQVNGSFVFDGLNRSWIVYLPVNYNQGETMPLLLALHGLTQTGQSIMQFSDFNSIADTGNFIVAYPNGVGNAWNVGFAGGSTADDVGFISSLIDTLFAQYNIDLTRVYATGFSNGGFLSYKLACELGNRIAAIAPVSGTMTEGAFTSCQPARNMPVLHIHGTNDIVVSYNGGFGNKSVDQVLAYWNGFNNCPGTAVIEDLPDLVAEGSTVQRYTWTPCDNASEVMLLKVINGGHTWPGSVGTTGYGITNRDISASGEIWSFVRFFSLEDATSIHVRSSEKLKIYPNPVSDGMLVIVSTSQLLGTEICVLTTDGREIMTQPITRGSYEISLDVSGLKSGLYLLKVSGGANVLTSKFVVR